MDWMSEEESDTDDSGPIMRISTPAWRSSDISIFLHGLDKPHLHRGPRRVPGQPKLHVQFPAGLPRICYGDTWFEDNAALLTLKGHRQPDNSHDSEMDRS